jgi:hypothetical protein
VFAVDRAQGLLDGRAPTGPVAGSQRDRAPVSAVDTQPDQVASSQQHTALGRMMLRHIADAPAARGDRPSVHECGAGSERQLTQQHLEQRRLAAAVGTQDRDELPRRGRQVEVVPEQAIAESQLGVLQRHHMAAGFGGRHRVVCHGRADPLDRSAASSRVTVLRCQVR